MEQVSLKDLWAFNLRQDVDRKFKSMAAEIEDVRVKNGEKKEEKKDGT
jgi:hypothetical protein